MTSRTIRENTAKQIAALPVCFNNNLLMKTDYIFLFEDTGLTHNINMHTQATRSVCPVDAINQALIYRPEFAGRKLRQCDRAPFLNFIQ